MSVRSSRSTQRPLTSTYDHLVLTDGVHRHRVVHAHDVADPELALMLHRVADARMPRLFGRAGTWRHERWPWTCLPRLDNDRIGVSAYPAAADAPLVVFEAISGTPLDALERFDVADASALHRTYTGLMRTLGAVLGPLAIGALTPGDIVKTDTDAFVFVEWRAARRASSGQTLCVARDRYDLALTVASALSRRAPERLSRWSARRALAPLPRPLRTALRAALVRPQALRGAAKRPRWSATSPLGDQPLPVDTFDDDEARVTVVVIPWNGERRPTLKIAHGHSARSSGRQSDGPDGCDTMAASTPGYPATGAITNESHSRRSSAKPGG